MKNKRCIKIFFSYFVICASFGASFVRAFHIDNNYASHQQSISPSETNKDAKAFFLKSMPPFHDEYIATSPESLLQAAKDTLSHFQKKKGDIFRELDPGFFREILPWKYVVHTLNYIIDLIEEDKKKGKFRILDPEFLNKNFNFIRWNADRDHALQQNIELPFNGNILLTNYVIYNVQARQHKTEKYIRARQHKQEQYTCALYQLLDKKIAPKFSKQEIIKGALEKPLYKKKVKALAWLTERDFEDVLLQGSVFVTFPNGVQKFFMVDVNNGIAYAKELRDKKLQRRYWFYREVPNKNGSLAQIKKKISSRKKVIFAGNIDLGIGKIIALRYVNQVTKKQEVMLGVLADTGGAFMNNLYQLDLFLGIYSNKETLKKQQKQIPSTAQAFIMYRREAFVNDHQKNHPLIKKTAVKNSGQKRTFMSKLSS